MFISTQPPQVKPCQDPCWIVSSSVGTLPTAAPLAVAGTGPFLNDKLLMFSSAILQFFVAGLKVDFPSHKWPPFCSRSYSSMMIKGSVSSGKINCDNIYFLASADAPPP